MRSELRARTLEGGFERVKSAPKNAAFKDDKLSEVMRPQFRFLPLERRDLAVEDVCHFQTSVSHSGVPSPDIARELLHR